MHPLLAGALRALPRLVVLFLRIEVHSSARDVVQCAKLVPQFTRLRLLKLYLQSARVDALSLRLALEGVAQSQSLQSLALTFCADTRTAYYNTDEDLREASVLQLSELGHHLRVAPALRELQITLVRETSLMRRTPDGTAAVCEGLFAGLVRLSQLQSLEVQVFGLQHTEQGNALNRGNEGPTCASSRD